MGLTSPKHSVAIVLADFALEGGVRVVADFLYRALSASNNYRPEIVSLAWSSRDQSSLRLLAPRSWVQGVRVTERTYQGRCYRHVGAHMVELEFQRYQPRRALHDILQQYDLIQVVAGTPAWSFVTDGLQVPVCLFTATTIQKERKTILQRTTGAKRYWLRLMTRINVHIERRALSNAACVFAESEYTRESLHHIVPADRLLLGIPGTDTVIFHPAETYQPDGYMLSVGRFADPRKNIRLLFKAYQQLRQRVSVVPKLVLAGQHPAHDDWNYAQSLGIVDTIEVYEKVSVDELARLYREASLFVLASNEEGLGLVILEAMASGLPVISTRCGGPETAVLEGKTGLLTPLGDADALAWAMQHLFDDPGLRRQMGQAGRVVAEQRFSISAASKVFLDCYDALLNSGI